jgi:hypothetical protein
MGQLVGQFSGAQVNRPTGSFSDGFRRNRGWDEIVTELVAAVVAVTKTGATNFLIAHLNNQAVPATAITARLFRVRCNARGATIIRRAWLSRPISGVNSFFHQTEAVATDRR